MTQRLLRDALEAKYKAQMLEAKATLSIYFNNPVGIGEHPQHLEEMDKFLTQYTDAKDKLENLNEIYPSFPEDDFMPF
jgi:hypothetical protein